MELCLWFITSPLWRFAFNHEKSIIFVFQSKIIYKYIIYKWPVVHFKIQCCHLEKTLNLIHWWKKIKESIIQQIQKRGNSISAIRIRNHEKNTKVIPKRRIIISEWLVGNMGTKGNKMICACNLNIVYQ